MPFLLIAPIACLLVAIASLVLPSGPTYDPYAWLIWGRDLAHLDLVTTGGGTSWKPLPALVDALLTPLGGGAAAGWVVVARAGALFGVLMAGRLAWRLAPRRGRGFAAVAAAATLLLTHEYVKRTGVAEAEGLMAALGLLAIDRHLDGHRTQTFALMLAGGLIRVEAWPFAAAYGLWMAWHATRPWRTLAGVALGGLLLPLLWFGGDWVGSGRLTTAADRALHHKAGTPGASQHPFQATLTETWQMVPLSAWIAVGIALAAIATRAWRRRAARGGGGPLQEPGGELAAGRGHVQPDRVVALLAASATAWILIVAVMAARGYAGLPRFLFMADGLVAVVAGVGVAQVISGSPALVQRALRDRLAVPRAAAVVAALVACGAFAFGLLPNAQLLPGDVKSIDKVADTDSSLVNAIDEAGGIDAILRCGSPTTTWYTVTAVAYDLRVPTARVRDRPQGSRPVVFQPQRGAWQVRPRHCPSRS